MSTLIDVSRALPVLRAAQSPDETAPLAAFAEGDAVVARSFNEGYTISYVVEESGVLAFVRWRDIDGDLDRLHDVALANLRARAATSLRLVSHESFVDVILDGKVDASLLLLDELWDGNGLVSRAIAAPIVAAAPSSESLVAASASSHVGVMHLRSLGAMLLIRRVGEWGVYGG